MDADGSRPQDTTLRHYTEQEFLKLLANESDWFEIVNNLEKADSGEWDYNIVTYYKIDDNGMRKLSLEDLKLLNPNYPTLKIPMEIIFLGNVPYENSEIADDVDYKDYRSHDYDDYVESGYRIKIKKIAFPVPLYLEVDTIGERHLTNKEIGWFKTSLENISDEFFKTLLKFLSKELEIPMEELKHQHTWETKIIPLQNIFIENDGEYFKEDLYSLEEFDIDYEDMLTSRKDDLILYIYDRCLKIME